MQFNEAWDHACSTAGLAARKGNLKLLKKLTAKGKPIDDVSDNRGWRPLQEAVYGNHIECVQYLLQLAKDGANWRTFDQQTALHLACEGKNGDMVKLLLEHEADINAQNDELRTPLMIAVIKSAHEIVSILLEYSCDVKCVDMNEWSALFFAVEKNDLPIVKLLLRNNADIHLRDEHGRNVIFLASELSHFKCLKLLVDYIIEKDERDLINVTTDDGTSALIIAAQKGSLEILKYLVQNGANVNHIDQSGCTALHLAVAHAHDIQCVNYLLMETDLTILNQPRVRDLVHLTVAKERHEVLQLLIDANLAINTECFIMGNAFDTESYTPLGRSIFFQDNKSFEMLLKAGANPNAVSERCAAPLTLFVERNNNEDDENMILQLLKNGAIVNYSKTKGCISEATELSMHKNKWNIFNILIKAGGDVTFDLGVEFADRNTHFLEKPVELIHDFLAVASRSLQWSSFLTLSNCNRLKTVQDYKPFVPDQPPSLKHFCRLKIRKLILLSGEPSLYKAELTKLGLPDVLAKYILFEDTVKGVKRNDLGSLFW